MKQNLEYFKDQNFSDQPRTGINLTERTFKHFGLLTPDFSEKGRVNFIPEMMIDSIDEKRYLQDNGIYDFLGPGFDSLASLKRQKVEVFTNDNESVFFEIPDEDLKSHFPLGCFSLSSKSGFSFSC